MAASNRFVLLQFNTASTSRFTNEAAGATPPAVTASPASSPPTIEIEKFFTGDAAVLFDGANYLDLATDARMSFNSAGLNRSIRIRFLPIQAVEMGIIGRRADADNRWNISIDFSNRLDNPAAADTFKFFARVGGSTKHNISTALPFTITLNRWHTLEMYMSTNTTYFYIDGYYVASSTDAGATTISPAAGVTIGRINDSTSTTASFKYFIGYMDDIEWWDNNSDPNGFYNTTVPAHPLVHHSVRTWSGQFDRKHEFSSPITASPSLLTNSLPQNIPDFTLVNNQCFIVGINPGKKVDGNTVYPLGFTLPANAPTTTAGGTGISGTYEYVITWVDARTNESGRSDPSIPLLVANKTITVDMNNTPPSNAVAWRIYRRNTATQSQYYFIAEEVIATTTYADSTVNADLFRVAPDAAIGPPPPCNFIIENNGITYYGACLVDGVKHFTRVYFSNPFQPEQVNSQNWFYVGQDDSEQITGFGIYEGSLIIFKAKSMYRPDSDPFRDDFNIVPISTSVGCVSHRTIKQVSNKLVWLSDAGVYLYNGGEPIPISSDIQPVFSKMPDDRKPYAVACEDVETGFYLLGLTEAGYTENNRIWAYNYRESFKDNIHRWTPWDVPTTAAASVHLTNKRNPRAMIADPSGFIATFERDTKDLNRGIDFSWKLTYINPINPGGRMRVRYITLLQELFSFRNTQISFGFDLGNIEQLTNFNLTDRVEVKVKVAARTPYISLVVEGKDVREPIKIFGFALDAMPVGQR